jgi:ABC-type polysaccharide/polyol phosphate export permease
VHGSNLPIVAFAVTGYSSVLLWRNMPSRCIGALEPNLSLFYHRNVRPIDVYLSRLTLEAAGATMSFVFLTLFFHFVGWLDLPEDVLTVAAGWFMIAWFGMALAIFLGALSEMSETVEKLWHPSAYLLFPLSGAAFLVDALPVAAQKLVLLLPMVHGVELLRHGYFGSRIVAHYDVSYMAVINLFLTVMGLALTRKVGRIVVPE